MSLIYHHRTLGDGAEGIHIEEMIEAFRALGQQVHVLSPFGEKANDQRFKSNLGKGIKSFFPPVFFELAELGYNVAGVFNLVKMVKKYAPDFIYDRYNLFNFSSVLVGKLCKLPVILEVNSPLALERSQQPDEVLVLKRLAHRLEKWICSNSFKTLAVSTPLKKYLVESGVPHEKILVLPNGVNLSKFFPDTVSPNVELARSLEIEDGSVILGFVGIMRPWHGIDFLINAFAKLAGEMSNLHLVLVGDGPIRGALEKMIAENNLAHKVSITGRIPHQRIPKYVSLFDIAISPCATFYACPMKIIEYMAMGKPIVAPRTENIRDIIEDRVTGYLFESKSEASLVEVLRLLITHPDVRKAVGEKARNATLQKLNWTNNSRKVLSLIQKKQPC